MNYVLGHNDAFDKFYKIVELNRPTRATNLNPDSSRSHLIIDFYITTTSGNDAPVTTKLSFVDLAGNEKADQNLFLMREEGDGISASLYGIKDALRNRQTGKDTQYAKFYQDNYAINKGVNPKDAQGNDIDQLREM